MQIEQDMVKGFHEAFRHPTVDEPSFLNRERLGSRMDWMREEINELAAAETLDDQADAVVDLIYFALGTLVEMGVDGEPLFHIVHNANMQKLWPDGKPRFRESDGKVIKPEGWLPPEPALREEIARQKNQEKVTA
jgi:predicted HAD superfamily Cof-like phosphohydrolase